MKIDSTIYLMVLILNHKYYFFIYIFSQSCFSGSENDNHLGTKRVPSYVALLPVGAASTSRVPINRVARETRSFSVL